MLFSRIRLDEGGLRDEAAWRRAEDAYETHRLAWRFFADEADRKRDFLYRAESVGRLPAFYTVSERPPRESPGWAVETKRYEPAVRAGDRLAFELRANPTRRHKNADGSDNGARHDVVMDAKHRLRTAGGKATLTVPEPELVQAEGTRWLADRAQRHGFRFEPGHVRADGYRQHRFEKPSGGKPLRISSVDFTGRLEVTDPIPFIEALRAGIGPAKGFGFGLLMVRRC